MTAALDNIDHNPSSTKAEGFFHGTEKSLSQHLTTDNQRIKREIKKAKEN